MVPPTLAVEPPADPTRAHVDEPRARVQIDADIGPRLVVNQRQSHRQAILDDPASALVADKSPESPNSSGIRP